MQSNAQNEPLSQAQEALREQKSKLYDDATNAAAHRSLEALSYINFNKGSLLIFKDGSTIESDYMSGSVAASNSGKWNAHEVDRAYQKQEDRKNDQKLFNEPPMLDRIFGLFNKRHDSDSIPDAANTAVTAKTYKPRP